MAKKKTTTKPKTPTEQPVQEQQVAEAAPEQPAPEVTAPQESVPEEKLPEKLDCNDSLSKIRVHRVFAKDGRILYEEDSQETIEITPFRTTPAVLGMTVGRTLNLGNFCSAKVDVMVQMPTYVEQMIECSEFVTGLAREMLSKEMEDVEKHFGVSLDEQVALGKLPKGQGVEAEPQMTPPAKTRQVAQSAPPPPPPAGQGMTPPPAPPVSAPPPPPAGQGMTPPPAPPVSAPPAAPGVPPATFGPQAPPAPPGDSVPF